MGERVLVEDVMRESGVAFGTSGARGLAEAMTDRVCYIYTAAFLQHLAQSEQLPASGCRVILGGDLRPSTGRIMAAAGRAAADLGFRPVDCGRIPSPALALYGIEERVPSVMVTGSHIPEDRNGIKYNTPTGEVLKADEAGIRAQTVAVPDLFDARGNLREAFVVRDTDEGARETYRARWLKAFPADFLSGRTIGLYQHSAVGRDLLQEIFSALGATVLPFGRSAEFVPVDTEAVRPEDCAIAREFAAQNKVDAIISTDGDSDRPLISDESGNWLRGDVAGILTAKFLQVGSVVVPVSCNSAVEKCGYFKKVRRSRIGSPFVIAGMLEEIAAGATAVAGYEANGGFLTATVLPVGKLKLPALPTRDPVIVQLAVLGLSAGSQVSKIVAQLPQRVTASDRIKNFPTMISAQRIAELSRGGAATIEAALPEMGPVEAMDETDGLRISFRSTEVLHFRPSGNAPELRCYAEAATQDRVEALLRIGLTYLKSWQG